jgi:hypothetical protein
LQFAPLWHDFAQRKYVTHDNKADDTYDDRGSVFSTSADKKRKRHAVTIHVQHNPKRQQQQSSRRNPFSMRRVEKTEINEAVRDGVFAYFDSVNNVPADGNCGYYVLYDFLQENDLLPESCCNVTDLRRIFYNFALEHKEELFTKNSYFITNGYWRVFNDPSGKRSEKVFLQDISNIYSEDVNFEGGCPGKYWMNANIVMPLVALCFDINVWLLSADGDPFTDPETGKKFDDQPYTTMFTVRNTKGGNKNVQREIIRGSVAFPVQSPKDRPCNKKTAYVIHVDGNHYISAKK